MLGVVQNSELKQAILNPPPPRVPFSVPTALAHARNSSPSQVLRVGLAPLLLLTYRLRSLRLISTAMDDDVSNSLRRMSTRARKVAPKMVAALASTDNRTQAILARLEALENDNPGAEVVEPNDDDDASLDEDDDQVYHKKQSKGTKRKTRQAKALETAKKAPRTFLELLHDVSGPDFLICYFCFIELPRSHCTIYETGKPGILASSCAILSKGSSWASKLHLPPPFLHCLWFLSKIYMRKMRNAFLCSPLSEYSQRYTLSEICCLDR
ncbi:hypothetical protein Ccrd_015218 [Cynara cardunculus var. scolymus]|uniref:Uncharacterized protein n=1 Tax=Cynara cardunculus var. scolymus TaxID=59895 RepID=A0A103YC79_CYNCS|nr:hypothetical protein Ccrd_015218 [Cynara cardunculus var. scolymus]